MHQKVTANKKGRKDARVNLWRDREEKTLLVARLVAAAWFGEPAEGMTVNHINGDQLDNRAENLEWVTHAENIKLGFSCGLYASIQRPTTLIHESGKAITFPSMAEAGRWLGRNCGYITNVKKTGRKATAKDGSQYMVV